MARYADIDYIERMVEMFDERTIRDMIYRELPSEQVISFTYSNLCALEITRVQRHHADKVPIRELIGSYLVWKNLVVPFDDDNDELGHYANMISLEDISKRETIKVEKDFINMNVEIGINRSSLEKGDLDITSNDLYDMVYTFEENKDENNKANEIDEALDLSSTKNENPGLSGYRVQVLEDLYNDVLKYREKLGIKVFSLGSVDTAGFYNILITWD